MQRRKKQLLGLAGLALVAAMTVIASVLPAPQASAAAEERSVGVGLKVTVGQPRLYVKINRVDDEAIVDESSQTVVRKELKVRVEYAHARKVGVALTDLGFLALDQAPSMPVAVTAAAIEPTSTTCGDVEYKDSVAYCDATFTLDQVDHQYKIAAVANDGEATMDDEYLIVYRSASIRYTGKNDNNGDPYVQVVLNDKVKLAMVQVYDANGKPVFMNGDVEAPLELNLSDLQDGVYAQELILKLKEAGAPAGTYTAVLVAYDTDNRDEITANPEGHLIAVSTAKNIKFVPHTPGQPDVPDVPDNPDNPDNPDAPDVPSTGKGLFSDLNISRADYIVTGLVAFGMVTIFAVFLIVRRNRR